MTTIEEKANDLLNEQKAKLENLTLEPGLYSVKDLVTGKFGIPFVAKNNEDAKRILKATMMDSDNMITKFCEDYQLFRLGCYNESTGLLVSKLEFLANASEFRQLKGE